APRRLDAGAAASVRALRGAARPLLPAPDGAAVGRARPPPVRRRAPGARPPARGAEGGADRRARPLPDPVPPAAGLGGRAAGAARDRGAGAGRDVDPALSGAR